MHECYADLPKRLPKSEDSTYKKPTEAQTQTLRGPQVFRVSTWSIMQWTLMTHAGFLTYHHKDANGLCTWLYAHVGMKVWAVLEPRYTDHHSSRARIHQLHRNIMNSAAIDEEADVFTAFLRPGQLLQVYLSGTLEFLTPLIYHRIMPPGVWHAVYTPTPTYCSGGHFYTYETMHLSEYSRAFDHIHGKFSTNADHAVDRVLCRMVLALRFVSDCKSEHVSKHILIKSTLNVNTQKCFGDHFLR